jgi:O-6-methylguanine DNA methyltransferase
MSRLMRLRLERASSPLGTMLLVTDDDDALRALDFADCESRMHRLLRLHYGTYALGAGPRSSALMWALTLYFNGELDALEMVRVATGGTPFQREVWSALRQIAPGATVSYGSLALQLGRRSASRAVGLANGSNPIAIIVPCHRVIGTNGALIGYAGGLVRKRWLLDHERRYGTVMS